jgi:hypothetical protein
MGKILYPRAYMGNPAGRIFFDGYEYGMVLPDGYVPITIPTGVTVHLIQLPTKGLKVCALSKVVQEELSPGWTVEAQQLHPGSQK